ncbi:Protein SERAC1 [Fusarium oxysporum f. sp. conglutinans]|nr:Protein SERAC1 [Fusarium oxysporum f. sp. conglutinans]
MDFSTEAIIAIIGALIWRLWEKRQRKQTSANTSASCLEFKALPLPRALLPINELPPQRKVVYVWVCCCCGQGGMKVGVGPCPVCGVPRCPNCPTQRNSNCDFHEIDTISTSAPNDSLMILYLRSRTFRVRGAPLDWDADRLRSFLAEREGSVGVIVKSLAHEIHGRSRTATVTFQTVPLRLQALQTGRTWSILLPKPSGCQSTRDQYLVLDDGFLGITTLFTPPADDHRVDVIALSGLGGHAFGSFKDRGGDYMWLRDSLPYDITGEDTNKPMARMMIYGYESSVGQSKSMQCLEDLATSFLNSLRALTSTPTTRPIILVAHSLGGLIVKQTLISLSKSKKEDDLKLVRAVYGIVFFGVPHDGMDISSLIPMVGDGPNRFLIESIGAINSQILSAQQREFHTALGGEGDSEIVCFYETVESPTAQKDERGDWSMTGPTAVLVTKSSATYCRWWESGPEHVCPVHRTHSDMVKFGPEDPEYDNVCVNLRRLARRAVTARYRIRASNMKYI